MSFPFKETAIYVAVAVVLGVLLTKYAVPYFFPGVALAKRMSNPLKIPNVKIPITSGMCDFSRRITEINTSNPYQQNFVYIPNSNNVKGGNQFSYTFWINLTSNKLKGSGKIIFMRGIYNEKYGTGKSKGLVEGHPDNDTLSTKDTLIKCPLVKFSDPDQSIGGAAPLLDIEFNTMKNPHNRVTLDEDVFKLVQSTPNNPKWYLVSIVFQDYMDFTNQEKGAQLQVFLNDSLVKTSVVKDDSIRVNNGDIVLTPTNRVFDKDSSFSNLTYYNYALDIVTIQNIFYERANKGSCDIATQASFIDMGGPKNREYNRLSLFNELQQIG
jgi:hypothetical protein